MRCLAAVFALLLTAAPAAADPVPPATAPPAASDAMTLALRREALYRTFQALEWKEPQKLVEEGETYAFYDGTLALVLLPVGVGLALSDGPKGRALAAPLTTAGGLALAGALAAALLDDGTAWRGPIGAAAFQLAHGTAYLGMGLADRRFLPGLAPLAIAGYAGAGLRLLEAALRPGLSEQALREDVATLADPERYVAMGEGEVERIEGHLAQLEDHWPGWVHALPHLAAAGASLTAALLADDDDVREMDAIAALPSLIMAGLAWSRGPDAFTLYEEQLERGARGRGVHVELVPSGLGVSLVGGF